MCRARDPQQTHGTNMFRSLKKSGRLKRISKVLGAEADFDDFVYSLGSEAGPKAQALSELFDLCEADPDLSQVLANYSADREQLKATYIALIANGAGQWVRGHYVAASAFAFVPTLECVLGAHPEGESLSEMAFKLFDYFEFGKFGPAEK
jgi:hypothetical protein